MIGVLVPLLATLLSACSVSDKLQWLDDRSGEVLQIVAGENPTAPSATSTDTGTSPAATASDDAGLSSTELRARIDDWLVSQALNRYGDPLGTNYEKGTPLIDPTSGENIERLDYILTKIPNLLDRIEESK